MEKKFSSQLPDKSGARNLEEVLLRLEKAGLRLKRHKCAFMLPTVEYLGHHILADGLHPTDEKVRAILDAPVPKDVTHINNQGKFSKKQQELQVFRFYRVVGQLFALAHFCQSEVTSNFTQVGALPKEVSLCPAQLRGDLVTLELVL